MSTKHPLTKHDLPLDSKTYCRARSHSILSNKPENQEHFNRCCMPYSFQPIRRSSREACALVAASKRLWHLAQSLQKRLEPQVARELDKMPTGELRCTKNPTTSGWPSPDGVDMSEIRRTKHPKPHHAGFHRTLMSLNSQTGSAIEFKCAAFVSEYPLPQLTESLVQSWPIC